MLRRTANIVIIAIVSLILLSPLGSKILAKAGADFPDWAGVGSEMSLLEARTTTHLQLPTIEGITNESFQQNTENWLADCVPMREQILLTYAKMQREAIRIARFPLGYDVYPTFFGSDFSYSEQYKVLLKTPGKATEEASKDMAARADWLDDIFADHGNIRFFVCPLPQSISLDDSPAAELVSNSNGYDFFCKSFLTHIRNATVVNAWVSFDEYLAGWNATDHHWGIEGAYYGYASIASALGFKDKLVDRGQLIVHDEPLFYGSLARRGRFTEIADHIRDYAFDIGELDITIDGATASYEDLVHQKLYASEAWDKAALTNRYAEYFHDDFGEIVISNAHSDSSKTLLLVSNSFSNNMERLFAKHYAKVIVYDARHNPLGLEEYLDAHPDIDDAVVMIDPENFRILH